MQRKSYSTGWENPSAGPIFILGICRRSGTNYLRNILALHPDCYYCGPIWEDGLIGHAHLLESYASLTYNQWNPKWKVNELVGPLEALCGCLGDGLIQFLKMQPQMSSDLDDVASIKHGHETLHDDFSQRRLLTKTPSVQNLKYFFKIFPRAHLIIIIRDGRSIAESAVRSFKWSYEKAIREWTRGARVILDFDRDMRDAGHSYLIVRYEDVYSNTKEELKKIFKFLDLNPEKYDFDAASNLKVSGSSELMKQGHEKVHWHWVEKPADFNPIDRWSGWGRKLHERFNWSAGDYLERFGYKQEIYEGREIIWKTWNLLLDIKWKVRAALRRVQTRYLKNLR